MELTYFCERIGLSGGAVRMISGFSKEEGERAYREAAALFHADKTCFFERVLRKKQADQWFLYLYCRMALDVFREYEKRRIPERVFWDTFRDLALWCSDCFEKTGEYGIREHGWFVRHMELTIFRLGRLEFERMPSEWEIQCEDAVLSAGEPLISIHIPAGEPLLKEACIQSVRQAFDFWGREYLYVCHSWLLGPELPGLLGENSRIRGFRELFDLLEADYQERQAEERIFSRLEADPRNYPGETSLQRNARAYLASSGRLGCGLGLLRKQEVLQTTG